MFARWLLRVEGKLFEVWRIKKFCISKSWKAVRVAYRWIKASDPNHTSIYALFTRWYDLIGIWRTTQENRTTTILYGSGIGYVIRWTICCVGVVSLGGYVFVLWSGWRKLCLLRDRNGRDQHIHIGILCKGLVASLCNHTSEVWYCAWSAHMRGWVQSSSELLRELWWKCTTSAELKLIG